MLPPLAVSRPALVLGVEHPRGLAVMRSLARAGVKVDVVDRYETSPGLSSRLPRRKHLFDTDDAEPTLAFLEALEGVDGAVLIPTNDHYLRIVARHRERLARRFTMTVPPWDRLDEALDKSRLFPVAKTIPVRTPVFFIPESAGDLERILTRLDFSRYDYIFSVPPTSDAEPPDRQKIRYTVPAGPDLASARRRGDDLIRRCGGPPMVQEVVPGDAADCLGVLMLVDEHHRPVGHRVVRRTTLYPYFQVSGHWYGGNVRCESVHDDEAVAATAALADRLKLTGVVTGEFRRRTSDGALVLMKIDPRVVGMVGLGAVLGFDVPMLLYRLHTGQPVAVESSYPDGVSWVWEKPYLLGVATSGLRGWREMPAALDAIRRAASLGVWSRDDPWPFISNAAGGVRSQVRQRFLREQARQRANRGLGWSPGGR
jgi:predicted ATP-grasp superfamily ATP-dependent carboligase